MTQALAQRTEQSLAQKDQLTPQDLVAQVRTIQEVMRAVMKKGEHYGVIPGTGDKPSLLKPGAEKLCLLFRLAPEYEVMPESQAGDAFIRYVVRCNLKHIPTGQFAGSGIGSCNTREAKYRWRSQDTGREVPKEYWDTRDPALLGGPQFKPRKKGQQWTVYEQIEHDNPWDYDNTIVKMAEKRALVAALLNATAASDIFSQDLEDLAANGVIDVTPQKEPDPERSATPPRPAAGDASTGAQKASGGGEPSKGGESAHPLRWWPECVNQQQQYRPDYDKVQAFAQAKGLTKDDIEAYVKASNFISRNGKKISSMKYLSAKNLEDLRADINDGVIQPAGGAMPPMTDDDIPF